MLTKIFLLVLTLVVVTVLALIVPDKLKRDAKKIDENEATTFSVDS